MSKVFVGMSGGVDSSVSALLLKEQGYDVTGVYMKNWSQDLPGMKCPWAEDLADAKRVAVKLGIDFEVWDFEDAYKKKVVDYMLKEFKAGRTPNPDIMCNQEIKFKLFYETAIKKGADFIATGHYARNGVESDKTPTLARAVDENKDQTYFLYRISDEALKHTIFPIGDLTKPEVKKLAEKHHLHNAYKKESMGVCFVGEVGMKDFLKTYLEQKPGEIRRIEDEKVLGYHEGAVFYTIGQRHGLYLNGEKGELNDGLPYYIVKKDIKNNILYVSKNLNNDNLWVNELELEDVVLRSKGLENNVLQGRFGGYDREREEREPRNDGRERLRSEKNIISSPLDIQVRLRHRAELIPAKFDGQKLIFENKIKRPASGQSAVIYSDKTCLGGGIIV